MARRFLHVLVLLFVVGLAGSTGPAGAAGDSAQAVPDLHPQPKWISRGHGTIDIPARVTVVAGRLADPAAVTLLSATLRRAGARTIDRRFSLASPRGFVAYVDRGRAASGGPAVPRISGGYLLAVGSRPDGGSSIRLAGFDRTGEYYASVTLRQILAGHRSLPALTIRDWPSLALRGIVEGFYGTKWTERERLSAIDFAAAHKMNTYIYMPKADENLRLRWRTAYPRRALGELRRAVQHAQHEHVAFAVGISPGDSVCYSSSSDRRALTTKLASLWSAGVRMFVVAFDDVDAKRRPCPADLSTFGKSDGARGKEQAALANAVDGWLRAAHPNAPALMTVPSEYAGDDSTPLKRAFARNLRADVVVQWTGPTGISPSVTPTNIAAARSNYRHRLVLWDNHYVNDYARGYLILGPLTGMPADPGPLVGVLADPMNEPEASKLGLFSEADYAWSPHTFRPAKSWGAAIRAMAGPDRTTERALAVFAETNLSSPLGTQQAPTLRAAADTFWKRWSNGEVSVAAAPLRRQLEKIAEAPVTLRTHLRNATFLAEAGPWLDATRLWAQSAIAALDALVEHREGAPGEAAHTARARALRTQAQAITIPSPTGPQAVAPGSGVLDALVHYALRGYGP
jgi:hypothetical protein